MGHDKGQNDSGPRLPEAPVYRITRPLSRFLQIEAASGVILGVCTALALVVANSGGLSAWTEFWERKLTIGVGSFELSYPLWYWVNDGLMTVFFFVVGLEIKRELAEGQLRDRRKVMLPIVAALGGAIVPAAIFLGFQLGESGERGWAIPMATDIAFVVGALAILGKRVPPGLKILLLSLAIVDDLIAVAVIALFYAQKVQSIWLMGAAAGIALILVFEKLGIRRIGIYVLVGTLLWLCTLKSGVHPTVAGVVLGVLTPTRPWISRPSLQDVVGSANEALQEPGMVPAKPRVLLEKLAFAAREAISPLERLETALHPWVGFVIMPVFALANAAVPVTLSGLQNRVALAIAVALVVGKPVGILLAAKLVVRLGWGALPEHVSWRGLAGAGLLCGTGFTMSLFVASLTFREDQLAAARIGVLLGSAVGLGVGLVWLRLSLGERDGDG